jgi:GNAT superfamily N-acetyltransferase
VIAVVPYRPPTPPELPAPHDALARPLALYLSLTVRRAVEVQDVPGGVAVSEPRFPASRAHNRLLLSDPMDADAVERIAAAVAAGAGWPDEAVTLSWPGAEPVAAALAARGWDVEELSLMARPSGPVTGGDLAEVVHQSEVHDLWDRSWRADAVASPETLDDVVRQLVGRERLDDTVLWVRDVVVRENGRVAAAGQLYVDGGTAAIESVLTDGAARGRGYGDAVPARCPALADDAGCDLVVLEAAAGDWPRHWYRRRGFTTLGSLWVTVRTGAQTGASTDSSR